MMAMEMADPCTFARRLGFVPDEAQARVMDRCVHRGILNCSRQWGKSTVTDSRLIGGQHGEFGKTRKVCGIVRVNSLDLTGLHGCDDLKIEDAATGHRSAARDIHLRHPNPANSHDRSNRQLLRVSGLRLFGVLWTSSWHA